MTTIVRGSDWGGSRLEAAQTCKRLYFNRYEREFPGTGIHGLVKLEDPVAASKGTLIHLAMQHYYKRVLESPAGDKATFVLEAIHHMIEAANKLNIPEASKPLMIEECIAAVDQYFQNYHSCSDIVPKAVEQPVSFKFTAPNGQVLVHTGIIDLLGEYHGGDFIVDHKTTSLSFDALYRSYTFSLSFKGYCKAARELYGEQIGVLVNAIRFKKNKSLEVELEREMFIFTEDELNEFEPTVSSIRREIEMCRETGFWPKASKQCSKPWGVCDYYQLCKFDDPAMIRALYKPAPSTEVSHEPPTT